MNIFDRLKKFFNNPLRLVISIILLIVASSFLYKNITSKTAEPTYQTAQAEKGTLVNSVTASGTILSSGKVNITTQASGLVDQVYVQDGDMVTQGQKIANITLDLNSRQKVAAAWANYLSAKNNLSSAQNTLNSLNSAMWKTQQVLIKDSITRGLPVDDPTYIQQNSDWLAAENNYKNQQGVVNASMASLNSAWLSYSQLSPIISAPISGIISGLTISPGLPITTTSNTTSTSTTSTSLGTITLEQSNTEATINLTEIDVIKVKPGQKVTLTLDAFPGKTFTGVISSVNTNGSVSSGVTTYPTTITFDIDSKDIYPNMAVNATIITDVKNGVILVPSSSLQTSNGQSSIKVMRDGQVISMPVEVGKSNDTQTEILSGINGGDIVITGQMSTTTTGQSGATSPFGNTRGGFGGTRQIQFMGR